MQIQKREHHDTRSRAFLKLKHMKSNHKIFDLGYDLIAALVHIPHIEIL